MKKDIRLFKPSLGEEELDNIKEAFQRAWLGLGPFVSKFEKEWTEYIGCKESIGVNSGTAALHLAVSAFKFPKGSKVLVPAMTFVSTANAALYNGLRPVFVDVNEEGIGISIDDLKSKYDRDCVAVMPVHFGGYPVPMDELMEWARSKNLKVIEDCAHCAGGSYKGKKLGTWGDIGCFSFEEKKGMTTGDGGMICSDDKDLVASLRHTRWCGINKDTWERFSENQNTGASDAYHWYYEVKEVGYKYNMNDLSAAIGLAQLKKLDRMRKRRAEIVERYVKGIKDCKNVRPGLPYDAKDSSYWIFMVRTKERDRFIVYMKGRGVSTGVHYMPLTMHPLYVKYDADLPVTKRIWREFVTLPLFPDLTDEEVDYVIACIREFDNGLNSKPLKKK